MKGLQPSFHLLNQCCYSEMTINVWAAVFLTRTLSCGVLHTSKAWGGSEEILYTCALGGAYLTKGGYIHLSWLSGLPSSWVVSGVKWLLSPVPDSKWLCGSERGLQGSAEAARWAKPAVLWSHKATAAMGSHRSQKKLLCVPVVSQVLHCLPQVSRVFG